MTNKTLRTNDTQPVRVLVALELSLKTWRLAMAMAGGDHVALGQAVEDRK
jgi:hypothetical protein